MQFNGPHNNRRPRVAVFRDDDSDPKERFYYHMAGADGRGGSSYIGAVFARDRDHDTGWNASSDGTLERRDYYLQNWRNDVIALVTDTGEQVEQIDYTPYGAPEGFPTGDVNKDGVTDSADEDAIRDVINNNDYYTSADLDYDGDVDSADVTTAQNNNGATLGRGALSDVGNRFGYTGHEYENSLGDSAPLWHARNRVLNSKIGRWLTRDPAGHIDGSNLYQHVNSNPILLIDQSGLAACVLGSICKVYNLSVTEVNITGPDCCEAASAVAFSTNFAKQSARRFCMADCMIVGAQLDANYQCPVGQVCEPPVTNVTLHNGCGGTIRFSWTCPGGTCFATYNYTGGWRLDISYGTCQ